MAQKGLTSYGGRPQANESGNVLAQLIEVKSLGGVNFVRPDRVVAIQTIATGGTVLVLEGGITVNSSETTKAVAERVETALLPR